MELQALTGSLAFAVTQVAVALFMTGLYIAARRDVCTRYWAIASALVAVGIILPFLLLRTSMRFPAVWLGTSAIVAGLIWMWWGMRVFFGRRPASLGWWLIVGHTVFLGGLFALVEEPYFRLVSFAVAVTVAAGLIMFEVWRGNGGPLTVARRLVVFAYAVTLLPIIVRASILLGSGTRMTPLTDGAFNVFLLYLMPMAGGLLGAVGTLLMYFERTIEEKDYLATHDELTALYNRRALTERGTRALEAAVREGRCVSLLLIDIDYFKTINDTLGHEAGDRALQAVARTLADACRRTDIIGRHGGEEFCILCPDTGAREAMQLSERLLAEVAAIDPLEGSPQRFSISIGMATAAGTPDWERLLRDADLALYAAKEAGRNRVVAA
jgi:diguanylate cyclase (GGDEF)-like protein